MTIPTHPPAKLVIPDQFPLLDGYPLLAAARDQAPLLPIDGDFAAEMAAAAAAVLGDPDKPRIQRLAAMVVQRMAKEMVATDPPARAAFYRKREYRFSNAMAVLEEDMLGDDPDDERMKHIVVSMSEYANELWYALRQAEEDVWEAREAAADKAKKNRPAVGFVHLPDAFVAELRTWRAAMYDMETGCPVPIDEDTADVYFGFAQRFTYDEDFARELRFGSAVAQLKMTILREDGRIWKKADDKEGLIADCNTNVDEGYQIALLEVGNLSDDAVLEKKELPGFDDDDVVKVPTPEEAAVFIWNKVVEGEDSMRERRADQEKEANRPGNKWQADNERIKFAMPENLPWGRLQDGLECYCSGIQMVLQDGFMKGPCRDDLKEEVVQLVELVEQVEDEGDDGEEEFSRIHRLSVVFILTTVSELEKDSDLWTGAPETLKTDVFVGAYEEALAALNAAGEDERLEKKEGDGYASKIWNKLVDLVNKSKEDSVKEGDTDSDADAESEAEADSDSDADSDADSDSDSDSDSDESEEEDVPEPQGKLLIPDIITSHEYFTLFCSKKQRQGADAPLSDKVARKLSSFAVALLTDDDTARETRLACAGLAHKVRILSKENALWNEATDIVDKTNTNIDAGYAQALGWLAELGDGQMEVRGPQQDATDSELVPIPSADQAAIEIWNTVARADAMARQAAEHQAAQAAREPGAKWKLGEVRFDFPQALAAALASKEDITTLCFPNIVKTIQEGFVNGPYPRETAMKVAMLVGQSIDSDSAPKDVATWELLALLNGLFGCYTEFWFEDPEDVFQMPARLNAAYNRVIAELEATPEGEQLESKEVSEQEGVTEDYYATALWNQVWERVRSSYPEEPGNSYTGKRVPVTIPAEMVAHAKVGPIIANVVNDGAVAMPCSDKIVKPFKDAVEEIIASDEDRKTRAAAVFTKHVLESFSRGDDWTWRHDYEWAVNLHRNYLKAYDLIVRWIDETPAGTPLKKRTTDFDGIEDYRRLWKLMWDELLEREDDQDSDDGERVDGTDDEKDD